MPTKPITPPHWLLRFLSVEAKFEALLFSLACGLLTALMLIYLLGSFSPIAVVVIASLSIAAFSSRFFLRLVGPQASTVQKSLIVILSFLLGLIFALSLSFAAIPSLGAAAMSSGAAFLSAYATAALYVIMALSVIQFTCSAISQWKLSQKRNTHLAQSFGRWMLSIKSTGASKSYTRPQKAYLIFGGICSLSAGIISGGLAYYSLSTLAPEVLLSLGFGWSIGPSILIPLAIAAFVITTLVLTKVILHSFIQKTEEAKANRKHSLFNALMEESASGIHFHQQPFLYSRLALNCLFKSLFSYQRYSKFLQAKREAPLSKAQFYARSLILCLLLPLALGGIAMSLYSNYLGSLQLLQQLFHLSESLSVTLCSAFTALGGLGFAVFCQESVEKGSRKLLKNIQAAPYPQRVAKGFNEFVYLKNAEGSAYIAAFSQRSSNPILIAFSLSLGFVSAFFQMFANKGLEGKNAETSGHEFSPAACTTSRTRNSRYSDSGGTGSGPEQDLGSRPQPW